MCLAMTVSEIMDKFGGLSAFASAIGVPTSTAFSWKDNNYIPAWRQPALLRLAVERNIALSTADFPPKRARQAA
jgi:hypothetical protein